MSTGSITYSRPALCGRARLSPSRLRARPELLGLLGLAGVLNLWGLEHQRLGQHLLQRRCALDVARAGTTSCSPRWTASGLMTVDKPPLALWVQALSARIFGFHPLSLLIPQALMGVVGALLVYDLVGRRFGRIAGFVAGLALATTPIAVAVSRHNNPDELLVLCSVAALWFALRAFETRPHPLAGAGGSRRRTRLRDQDGRRADGGPRDRSGLDVGLRARGRARLLSLSQLLAGGAAMVIAGGAWPLLVTLTPASDRPWISGTSRQQHLVADLRLQRARTSRRSDRRPERRWRARRRRPGRRNAVRRRHRPVPAAPVRARRPGRMAARASRSWPGSGCFVATRLRRRDPRTRLAARGRRRVPHHRGRLQLRQRDLPSLLRLAARPVRRRADRRRASAQILARRSARTDPGRGWRSQRGVVTELVVLGECRRRSLVGAAARDRRRRPCAVLLALELAPRARAGHPGRRARRPARRAGDLGCRDARACDQRHLPGGRACALGRRRRWPARHARRRAPGGSAADGLRPAALYRRQDRSPARDHSARARARARRRGRGRWARAPARVPVASASNSTELTAAVRYAKAHGGGTIGVSSQSSAAAAIISSDANVAGLGGFSGRESSVSASWIASEVRSGHLRWVLADSGAGHAPSGRHPHREPERLCRSWPRPASESTFTTGGQTVTMYDCLGRASAISAAAGK